MATGFKASEKMFRKMSNPETAIKEGKAIDLDGHEGYECLGNIDFMNRSCRLLTFAGFEGSYVISNAFSRSMQVELAQHCLSDCLQPENKTNLHSHTENSIISSQMKDIWARESRLIDDLKGDPCPKLPKDAVISKIRWVTLGYQYDWTLRKYIKDDFVLFPSKLATICSEIGEILGSKFSMKPDAAIVNFYPEGAVMGGHIDDAEQTYDYPVISISIGCPCVFLLGGLDKEINPIPIILKSGDVLIMGGPSRLRVHGVPKVFSKYLPPTYLHPTTARTDIIHRSDCIHFLSCRKNTESEKSNINAAWNDVLNGVLIDDLVDHSQSIHSKRHAPFLSAGSLDNVESHKRSKCSELDGISDNITNTIDSIENKDDNNSCSNTEIKKNENCLSQCKYCSTLSVQEEIRILRFLQTTRINVNVRQAYSDIDPTQLP